MKEGYLYHQDLVSEFIILIQVSALLMVQQYQVAEVPTLLVGKVQHQLLATHHLQQDIQAATEHYVTGMLQIQFASITG